MKRLLTALLCLLVLCAGAQERYVAYPRQDGHFPKRIRQAPLFGKKIIVFGDSYVQNADRPVTETWHCRLAARYNMEYHNWGWNGNCLAYMWGEPYGPPLFERYTDLPDGADYVVVIAGHNDAVLLDRYGDDISFFRDRLILLCEGLQAKYPEAKIVFVTPWGAPLPMFRETIGTILEVCGERGIPVFDASAHSGLDPGRRLHRLLFYQSRHDMAHLSARGHRRMLRRIEPFLLAL